ncbi:MAG: type I methionyl aminopeptidase [Candidatus Eisenbacteria bacterium]|uniref:Methionine aminopeptidase n=1 Tax=Eiseniibacteriota bacterium TaxID=2212470 RepID=A0A938BQW1_UNCEI|nr:type I methionyl aminopeptidase [Candidatus Eisenbacteria bacterium]
MIAIRRPDEVERIRASGRIVGAALRLVQEMIRPGVTTREIDEEVERFIVAQEARPSFKGYRGYPASACISVNDVVVHGIPSSRQLEEGDIVSVDVGAFKDGYHGDGAWTFPVGRVDEASAGLLRVTREALEAGIARARAGHRLGEISHAIQQHVESHGFSVVRMLVGHGIGTQLHEDPQVPNFGGRRQGPLLAAGMVLAVEPMVNSGGFEVYTEPDQWTVVTRDHSRSAHFEHTIAVTENGPDILTLPGPGSGA